ncbi:MoxR family ATPase [Kineosporia sp. J2-2]|uniref:MoxR family ATPase n=1 Tax=Kineosporia corallincola TaxID=2835133 RepID=A0ABS5TQ67_9ACTN|nr:MoxR family ATPase [Kineosporia corallincola]MBT0772499.1 MoxR family ATPase [Kineosporia corallincola]
MTSTPPDVALTRNRVATHLVGREHELELVLSAVAAGRDLVLEGPPGTGKTTLLRAIADEWGIPLFYVEGNADLTPAKLVGHHNPARVLKEDYSEANFVPGPLLEAMRQGGFLYLEEFNRAPDDTLNTLLAALAERRIAVPRAGQVQASPTFRLIASMNPYDNVGTTRLSTSITDRLCRLSVDYQDESAEIGIVGLRTENGGKLGDLLVRDAVWVNRATRRHPHLRQGSSVRGAIDVVLVANQLAAIRGVSEAADSSDRLDPESAYPQLVLDAMTVSLSGRVHLDEVADTTPERVIREIWEDRFVLSPASAQPG